MLIPGGKMLVKSWCEPIVLVTVVVVLNAVTVAKSDVELMCDG